MTEKIIALTAHFAKHKKDMAGKRGYQVRNVYRTVVLCSLQRTCAYSDAKSLCLAISYCFIVLCKFGCAQFGVKPVQNTSSCH